VPVATFGATIAAQPTPAAAVSRAPRRVLVVDDNADAAEMLAMLLSLDGHEVQTAGNGPEAIDVARRFRPEVAFLDIGLPGMSGYELAERFRADPELEAVALIAVTGWGQAEDRRRSREAGFDEHLTKPVDASTVLDILSRR
jgi:CheY-like chemotaxis protein